MHNGHQSPSLSFLSITSSNLCHVTHGVNAANGVRVGGVCAAVKNQRCKNVERKGTMSFPLLSDTYL